MRRAAAIVRKFASAFPNLNKSTVHSYHAAKVQRRIKQAKKEQRELKQVIANKRRGKPLLGDIDETVQDYLKVSEFIKLNLRYLLSLHPFAPAAPSEDTNIILT